MPIPPSRIKHSKDLVSSARPPQLTTNEGPSAKSACPTLPIPRKAKPKSEFPSRAAPPAPSTPQTPTRPPRWEAEPAESFPLSGGLQTPKPATPAYSTVAHSWHFLTAVNHRFGQGLGPAIPRRHPFLRIPLAPPNHTHYDALAALFFPQPPSCFRQPPPCRPSLDLPHWATVLAGGLPLSRHPVSRRPPVLRVSSPKWSRLVWRSWRLYACFKAICRRRMR